MDLLKPAIDPCPLFHIVIAAAMVKRVWIIVPKKSHARVFEPILSPIRPRDAPPRKVKRETRACLSAISNWKFVFPGENNRAIAKANYENRSEFRMIVGLIWECALPEQCYLSEIHTIRKQPWRRWNHYTKLVWHNSFFAHHFRKLDSHKPSHKAVHCKRRSWLLGVDVFHEIFPPWEPISAFWYYGPW